MDNKLIEAEIYVEQTENQHKQALHLLRSKRTENSEKIRVLEEEILKEKKMVNDAIESERLTRVMAGQMVKAREDAILQLKKYIRDMNNGNSNSSTDNNKNGMIISNESSTTEE